MPYTEKQRKLFNAEANDPGIAREHGTSGREARRLADEANKFKGEGRERKPVGKADLPEGVIDLAPVFGSRSDG